MNDGRSTTPTTTAPRTTAPATTSGTTTSGTTTSGTTTPSASEPRGGPAFDEVIHAPHRLRICAFLDGVDSAEFSALRDDLEITDAMLSKHLAVLRDQGYLVLDKPRGRGRVRTWVRMTPAGRRAYHGHVAALHELVGRSTPAD